VSLPLPLLSAKPRTLAYAACPLALFHFPQGRERKERMQGGGDN